MNILTISKIFKISVINTFKYYSFLCSLIKYNIVKVIFFRLINNYYDIKKIKLFLIIIIKLFWRLVII